MHEYGGLAFIDFAASAPYDEINMHPDDPFEKLDAIFFSPHKFLGGPGSSGVLVFDSSIYDSKTPDQPGGGTVDWTNPWGEYKYIDNIEIREDGGTPGFLQAMRTALALELKNLRREDKLTPDLVFRDPYLLDFLGLKDTYAEKDLELAILREMEAFILELGVGFCFVERQKRMQIDHKDHYLDLLFYHRHLRRMVAIDLKLEEFKAGDKGQMELYLNWLDRYERKEGEGKPIGLIICAGKLQETIELLDMEQDGIRVSSYWTEILPKKQLERKLHDAVQLARARLEKLNAAK